MAVTNSRECGIEIAHLEPVEASLLSARETWYPVATDNRLHAWEWIQTGDGIFKTDVADHFLTHDCIGCQDIGWDLAGAEIELGLSEEELNEIQEETAGTSAKARRFREARDFYVFCYLSFQLAWYTAAVSQLQKGFPAEAARAQAAAMRYRRLLTP
jgi:hypothetical protein